MKPRLTESEKETIRQMGRMCQYYVCPIVIYDPQDKKANFIHDAATCTFIDTGNTNIIITNMHVLKEYRKARSKNKQIRFRIDSIFFTPEERLIDESEAADLVTFSIDKTELEKIKKQGAIFRRWPPKRPKMDDVVIIAGFLGFYRKRKAPKSMSFGFLSAVEFVGDSTDRMFTVTFDRDQWIKIDGIEDFSEFKKLRNFGGISGSAVFRVNKPSDLLPVESIGIVFEYGCQFDILRASHMDFVNPDGTIRKDK